MADFSVICEHKEGQHTRLGEEIQIAQIFEICYFLSLANVIVSLLREHIKACHNVDENKQSQSDAEQATDDCVVMVTFLVEMQGYWVAEPVGAFNLIS